MTTRVLFPGDTLLQRGQTTESVFVLLKGNLQLTALGDDVEVVRKTMLRARELSRITRARGTEGVAAGGSTATDSQVSKLHASDKLQSHLNLSAEELLLQHLLSKSAAKNYEASDDASSGKDAAKSRHAAALLSAEKTAHGIDGVGSGEMHRTAAPGCVVGFASFAAHLDLAIAKRVAFASESAHACHEEAQTRYQMYFRTDALNQERQRLRLLAAKSVARATRSAMEREKTHCASVEGAHRDPQANNAQTNFLDADTNLRSLVANIEQRVLANFAAASRVAEMKVDQDLFCAPTDAADSKSRVARGAPVEQASRRSTIQTRSRHDAVAVEYQHAVETVTAESMPTVVLELKASDVAECFADAFWVHYIATIGCFGDLGASAGESGGLPRFSSDLHSKIIRKRLDGGGENLKTDELRYYRLQSDDDEPGATTSRQHETDENPFDGKSTLVQPALVEPRNLKNQPVPATTAKNCRQNEIQKLTNPFKMATHPDSRSTRRHTGRPRQGE